MRVLVLAAALLVAGCAAERPRFAELGGTVTYHGRTVLLPDTQLRVTLNETARADAPAQLVAETTIPGVTRVPVEFRIRFDPRAIDAKLVYTLTARIEREGRLLLVNDTEVRVLTGGAPGRVEIVVVPAGGRRD